MNLPIRFDFSGGLDRLTASDVAALGPECKNHKQAADRLFGQLDRLASGGMLNDQAMGLLKATKGRRDSTENFLVNALEQMFSTITRGPETTTLMTGPNSVLPVRQTIRPGQTGGVYGIKTPMGSAAWADPEGVRRLPQVGAQEEQERFSTDWNGIGWGFGLIEGWQAAEMGRSLDAERASEARSELQRFNEKALLEGDVGHQIQGLKRHSRSLVCHLGASFESLAVTDYDGALSLLQRIDYYFRRMAESIRGEITSVVAPLRDHYRLQAIRAGTNSEGQSVLTVAAQTMPWIGRIRWIDGLEGSSEAGGNQWIAWSDDSNELWSEYSPTPMVFGPWTDGLRTSFALLAHCGGVVLRRPERMVRFTFTP